MAALDVDPSVTNDVANPSVSFDVMLTPGPSPEIPFMNPPIPSVAEPMPVASLPKMDRAGPNAATMSPVCTTFRCSSVDRSLNPCSRLSSAFAPCVTIGSNTFPRLTMAVSASPRRYSSDHPISLMRFLAISVA